ncbi:unnamed protein product [Meganyctiphanes norvegica]|uniref:Uncharacterized protein n=1 Tax=Meganyctiphanes norvegica TaxID=48144 RepID=A0AAV2QVQ4_MEGNR
MSESIVKEEFGDKFTQQPNITFYNNEIRNNSYKVEVKHNNENLKDSTLDNFEVKAKEEIKGNEEAIQISGDAIKCKEELEIKEESIYFTEETYQKTHTGNKTYQCSHCDNLLSTNNETI